VLIKITNKYAHVQERKRGKVHLVLREDIAPGRCEVPTHEPLRNELANVTLARNTMIRAGALGWEWDRFIKVASANNLSLREALDAIL
jgi:hypothetical protein